MNLSIPIFLQKISFIIFCTFFYILPVFSQCNGFNYLCDRKYNEVAYLTTHNAYNSEQDSFLLPNHHFNIATQLQAGVRGLMIDVYDTEGTTAVYHTNAILGSAPFVNFLVDIKAFLDQQPNEIVTIILECYTTANAIEADLIEVGLMPYLYTQTINEEWATLQTMIDQNTRLVLFSDVNDANTQQAWYHYVWDFAVETPFSHQSIHSFNCDFNRGNPQNDLFILNHFVTNIVGVGDVAATNLANVNPFFIDRALMCQELTTKFPNFITVDFYELGNCFEVVEQLNTNNILATIATTTLSSSVLLYPNPTPHIITLKQDKTTEEPLQIFTVTGEVITPQVFIKRTKECEWQLDFSEVVKGIYFIKTSNTVEKIIRL